MTHGGIRSFDGLLPPVIPYRQVLAFKSGIIKPFAIPSDVCEVSEERREKETGPFLPDKMMQVFVKAGGSTVLLQLLSLVCVHTHTVTHYNTHPAAAA